MRKALSEKLPAIAKSVGDSAAGKRLLPLFSKLLKGKKCKSFGNHLLQPHFNSLNLDKEPEVRSAACGALGDMSQFAPSGTVLCVCFCKKLIREDIFAFVFGALVFTGLNEHIVPLLEGLAADPVSSRYLGATLYVF